ncbi:MAG: hypothetical protein QF828_06695 [Pseudomonadales bacterium]|nr:hypothetical protein [Pseudomonadales bacterium]
MTIITAKINDATIMHHHIPDIVGQVTRRWVNVSPGPTLVVANRQSTVGAYIHIRGIIGVDANSKRRRFIPPSIATEAVWRCGGPRVGPGIPSIYAYINACKRIDSSVVERSGVDAVIIYRANFNVPGSYRQVVVKPLPG